MACGSGLCLTITLTAIAVATTTVSADPVVITFDAPPCAPLTGDIYPGTCYAASGVGFVSLGHVTAPVIRFAASPVAVSAPNVVSGDLIWFGRRSYDVGMSFVAPDGGVGTTDFVSWRVTNTAAGDPWGARLFGLDGSVLANMISFGDQLVSFSRPQRDIYFAAWYSGGHGAAPIGIDDLAFNRPLAPAQPSPVPEPATLLLIGSGLAALAKGGRRQRRPT